MRRSPPSDPPRLDELTFHLQPIFRADGRTVDAYEALVRWPRPDGTVRGPDDFLAPILQGRGLAAFTRFGIVRMATLLADHAELPALHLNLSPRQLALPDVERLLAGLHGDVRRRLRIELTEQRIPDPGAYAASVERLVRLGVAVWLDDVRPHELPDRAPERALLAGVKLDREVVRALLEEPWDGTEAAVRRLTMQGVPVTAEGVEDRSLLPPLRALGVRFFQGFGLGTPQPDLRTALARFPVRLRDPRAERRSVEAADPGARDGDR